jgi:hypothetical protein
VLVRAVGPTDDAVNVMHALADDVGVAAVSVTTACSTALCAPSMSSAPPQVFRRFDGHPHMSAGRLAGRHEEPVGNAGDQVAPLRQIKYKLTLELADRSLGTAVGYAELTASCRVLSDHP